MFDSYIRDRTMLGLSLLSAFAAAVVLPPFVGISVDYASFRPVLALCAVIAAFLPYINWRGLHRLRAALETMLSNTLFAIPLLVFSYVTMRAGLPLMDKPLVAADAFLGFDSRGFVLWMDQFGILSLMLGYCYSSFSFQLLLLPVLLGILGLDHRAYGFALAFIILGIASTSLSAFFPSIGAFAQFGIDSHALKNINGIYGYHFLESFNGVRQAPIYHLSLRSASGIITFPSVHAGVAVLCAWAAWGSHWLRWPFLLLNVGMFVSAITHGAHYLVDVIAGGAIGAVAIVLVGRLIFARELAPPVVTARRAAPAGAGEARSA